MRPFSHHERLMLELSIALGGHGQIVVVQRISADRAVIAPRLLEEAAAAVSARHALMRSVVTGDRRGMRIAEPALPLPVSVAAAGSDAWAVAEAEVCAPLPVASGLLWRLIWVPPPSGCAAAHHAVLSLSHSVGDGISAIALLSEFVEAVLRPPLAAAVAEDESAPCEGRLLPAPTSDALAAKEGAAWKNRFAAQPWPCSRGPRLHLRHSELAPSDAGAALRACRANGATLNAAIVAALVVAAHEHLAREQERDAVPTLAAAADAPAGLPLCVNVCVDLRKLCAPPVSHGELGCYFDVATSLHIALPGDGDNCARGRFWTLARESREQVAAFVHRRVFHPHSYTDEEVAAAVAGAVASVSDAGPRTSHYALFQSNVGVQPTPPEVEAVFFSSNQRDGIVSCLPSVATTSSGHVTITSVHVDPAFARVHDRMMELIHTHCVATGWGDSTGSVAGGAAAL